MSIVQMVYMRYKLFGACRAQNMKNSKQYITVNSKSQKIEQKKTQVFHGKIDSYIHANAV
jgi:hypothetical protein